MSERAFDRLVAATDPAMVVVTTTAEDVRAGCLVGFHSQSSMSTRQYCVWLSKANHTYRVALRASHLAVHLLTDQDMGVAELFGTRTGEDNDKFEGLEIDTGEHGVPLLRACPHQLVLERIVVVDDGGDHVCFTGRVLRASSDGELAPLRLSDVVHLRPGRSKDEHAVHP